MVVHSIPDNDGLMTFFYDNVERNSKLINIHKHSSLICPPPRIKLT